jgi:signal transduction histidine kinase/DNA-binding NarL/FixJ family response regulator/purine-cytosine permease-like protein
MFSRQRILPIRRDYNRFVANQTLEDYALRFTAKSARRWSPLRIAQTAIGAISFLALEAIGGAITLAHGFVNAAAAIIVVSIIMLVTGLPISRYAARYGVDIDLLTRGAGFGYIGSTVTSLIYASFTFILFAIEASIMSSALELAFGIPLWISYILSALAVIPLVVYGITAISRFQLWTQPFWIVLNVAPFVFIIWHDWPQIIAWQQFGGLASGGQPGTLWESFDFLRFGMASSVILSLIAQIGEQVDFLRFLPAKQKREATTGKLFDRASPGSAGVADRNWYTALFLAGPGWVLLGAPKLFAGSLLAVIALRYGIPAAHAGEPAYMYEVAFQYMMPSKEMAVVLTAAFVVVSQLKINVMNAYAGSLAWSNFFSRLTHSHPGRVVWLVFNVAIALLLMELGIYQALEKTLGLFSILAVSWLGAIVADLAINKPLGLSPPGIEFKRAHLYDVNPVGTGAMVGAASLGIAAAAGQFGVLATAFAPFVSLATALVLAPVIAWATGGRYYLARKPRASWAAMKTIQCRICEHDFEPEDSAFCPAYGAPICSLCCSLDARCGDLCKPHARAANQARVAIQAMLPKFLAHSVSQRLVEFLGVFALLTGVISLVLLVIHFQVGETEYGIISRALWAAFFVALIVAGVIAWFFVLAHESRRVAEEESKRQTSLLLAEIKAHERTDAALQKAKEAAEAANFAKSRYLVGLSHELRTPLNAVMGYAQVLERDNAIPEPRQNAVRVIRRSAEHLSGLIDGLLDISKIEAGRLQLSRNQVRLAEFLAQIDDMFRFQAEAKGLKFTFTRPEFLPEVVGTDEKRLRQVLVNLLSNAIKFTNAGSVELRLSLRNDVATFTVIDTGPGIQSDELVLIFEPFERGVGAAGQPGLGLGLTITKMLATLMGGDISVTSEPGEGSQFRVRLMLATIASPDAPPPGPLMIRGYAGPRRTIMVVDDNAEHRDLVREILEPLGFNILMAADGPGCLTLSQELAPDLYLLDISMPGMNGWELARKLRADGFTEPRIIILSANIGETRPPVFEDQLHDDAIAKPFDLRQLVERLGVQLGLEWLEEGVMASDVAAPASAPPSPQSGLKAKDIAELLQFARIGYRRGLEKRMSELEAAGDGDPVFASLSQHLAQFNMAGLISMLEEMDLDIDSSGTISAKSGTELGRSMGVQESEGSDAVV